MSMTWGERPVIVIGHGVRASGADPAPLMEMGLPILTSWQGMDLVDNFHRMYFGRPGIYGQRCANKVLYHADEIISVGTRMCVWMIGHGGLKPDQKLFLVDIDSKEGAKHPQADQIFLDCADWIRMMTGIKIERPGWVALCNAWKSEHPWIESPTHDDTEYINSYRFIQKLEPMLKADQVIVVDNGSLMCPIFQGLHVKPPQRVMTSGCLGEMGCALPGAIGASFARGKGEVLAMIGDGGMMMNIQELATIKHHALPIKIFVFENNGYSMIKGTYDNVKKKRVGVSAETGLSLPDFYKVGTAFGIQAYNIRRWEDFDVFMPFILGSKHPVVVQVHIDPEQAFLPRLKPVIKDGKITPARFDQLSPIQESRELPHHAALGMGLAA